MPGVTFDEIVNGLPDPFKDERPPEVPIDPAAAAAIKAAEKAKRELLNPKTHTEQRVKYVLGSLMGADLQKDGDWITTGKGFRTFQKKTADLRGGVFMPGNTKLTSLFVEVKGCSPGTNFYLGRLDTDTKKKKSQHERLTIAQDKGHIVWLALGWWYARRGAQQVLEERNGREYKRWKLEDVYLSIDLVPWNVWTDEILPCIDRRSFVRKDRPLLCSCRIDKVGNRWKLADSHWWWDIGIEVMQFIGAAS